MKEPVVDPQSASEILRASTILLIQLRDIRFGPWVNEAEGPLMAREVTMQVIIEDVLKGEVEQRVGRPFEFRVRQRGTGDVVVMDYYGLWSHVPLADGVRLIAFCLCDSKDATILLTEGNCEQLLEAHLALEDTKAALQLEKEDLSTAAILAQAVRQTAQRGDVFARYIAAKTMRNPTPAPDQQTELLHRSLVADDPPLESSNDPFEGIIMILEDPKTTMEARATYLTSIYDDISMTASPPRERVIRFAQALFKLLSLPEAEPLHSSISQVYLPNLLGLNNPPGRYSVRDVFQGRDAERLTILDKLKKQIKSGFNSKLISWLEGNET